MKLYIVHIEDDRKTQASLTKTSTFPGHNSLGLRANAPDEERLEGISAGIGVLAGSFARNRAAGCNEIAENEMWGFPKMEVPQ